MPNISGNSTWATGDTITATKLNNLQDSLAQAQASTADSASTTAGTLNLRTDNNSLQFYSNAAYRVVGLTKIGETVLGSAAASITFSSIPATFRHLHLMVQGRTDRAATVDEFFLRLNSDTGANYDYQQLYAAGATVTGAQTLAAAGVGIGFVPAASSTDKHSAQLVVSLANYASTSFGKTLSAEGAARVGSVANLYVTHTAAFWNDASAITAVTLLSANAANLTAGTVATLYGTNV